MPQFMRPSGEMFWLDDDEIPQRLAELRAYPRPTTQQRSEIESLTRWAERRQQVMGFAGNPVARMPGTDQRSGYDAAQAAERDRAAGTGSDYDQWRSDPRIDMSRHGDVIIRTARQSIERSHKVGQLPDRGAAMLERALTTGPAHERVAVGSYVQRTGDEEYQRALASLLIDPHGHLLLSDRQKMAIDQAREARRALALGTPAAWSPGSYPVPYQLDPTVTLTSNGAINPLRQLARVEQIVGKEWLGVTSTGVTVTRELESTETTDAAPTLVQPGVAPTRVQAFVPFSVEVEQDWNGLMAEIAMMLADAKDVEEATAFVTGNGTAPNPQGIVTALAGTGQEVTTAAAGTVALDDLLLAQRTVYPRFRARAQWAASLDLLQYARTHERGVTTQPILDGDDMLGWTASELSSLGAISTGQHVAVCGDWKQFLIVDRIGMSIELVPHLFGTANNFPTGQRGIFALWRNASQVLAPTAFATVKVQ